SLNSNIGKGNTPPATLWDPSACQGGIRLYHQPTPDDEQNGGEDQSQDPIGDTDCHPDTDSDTGHGTRQQRAENANIDRAEESMLGIAIKVNGTACAMSDPTIRGVGSSG